MIWGKTEVRYLLHNIDAHDIRAIHVNEQSNAPQKRTESEKIPTQTNFRACKGDVESGDSCTSNPSLTFSHSTN
jgi:hypothetical protein